MRMKILLAAVAALSVAIPSIASAQDVNVRIGGDRGYHRDGVVVRGARAEYGRHDRGLHRGWRHADKVVIIKKRHHRHWD